MGGDGRGGSDSHRLDAANAGRGGANGDRGEEEDAARKRKILSGRRRIADRRFSTMGFLLWLFLLLLLLLLLLRWSFFLCL